MCKFAYITCICMCERRAVCSPVVACGDCVCVRVRAVRSTPDLAEVAQCVFLAVNVFISKNPYIDISCIQGLGSTFFFFSKIRVSLVHTGVLDDLINNHSTYGGFCRPRPVVM